MRTVTPGNEGGLALEGGASRALEFSDDAVTDVVKAKELGLALDFDAGAAKVLDEQSFVLFLWKDERTRERAQTLSDVAQRDAGLVLAPNPEINLRNLQPFFDDLLGDSELGIELKGPRLHGQSTGRRSRFRCLVDDAYADSKALEPQRQNQAGGSGADDEHLCC